MALVFSGAFTVCCTHLLFLLITSLWTLAPKAVFANAYSIYWVVLRCTARILSGFHCRAWLSLAGGPIYQEHEHHFCW